MSHGACEQGMTSLTQVPRFDLIWKDPQPYSKVNKITSECCPGLDRCTR